MNFLKSLVTAAAATLILGAGAATAQTAAPAAKPAAAAPASAAKPVAAAPATAKSAKAKVAKAKAKKPKAARTAESIACSAEANAKGLKGKDRKKFRAACMKKAKAAQKKAA